MKRKRTRTNYLAKTDSKYIAGTAVEAAVLAKHLQQLLATARGATGQASARAATAMANNLHRPPRHQYQYLPAFKIPPQRMLALQAAVPTAAAIASRPSVAAPGPRRSGRWLATWVAVAS